MNNDTDVEAIVDWLAHRCQYAPPCDRCAYCTIRKTIPWFDSGKSSVSSKSDIARLSREAAEKIALSIGETDFSYAKHRAKNPHDKYLTESGEGDSVLASMAAIIESVFTTSNMQGVPAETLVLLKRQLEKISECPCAMCSDCILTLGNDIVPIVDSLIVRHGTGSDLFAAGVEAAAKDVELWADSLEENQQPAILVASVRTLARNCRALLPAGYQKQCADEKNERKVDNYNDGTI